MTPELRLLLGLGLCATVFSVFMLALALWNRRVRQRANHPKLDSLTRPDGYQRQVELNQWARDQERRAFRKLALLACVLPLLLGCVPAKAIETAEKFRALNAADAADSKNSDAVRAFALTEHDGWCVMLEALDGQELPADVAARIGAPRCPMDVLPVLYGPSRWEWQAVEVASGVLAMLPVRAR